MSALTERARFSNGDLGGRPWLRDGLAFLLLTAASMSACSPEGVVGVTTEIPADIALYETFELVVRGRAEDSNPFTQFVEATFSLDDTEVFVDGFYDGNDTWRLRFAPAVPGEWHYEWRLGRQRGSGVLRVGPDAWISRPEGDAGPGFRHRGHVHPQGEDRIALVHGDGSTHYWVGAKWFSAKNYGPLAKGGARNDREEDGSLHDAYYTDETFYAFLDRATELGLNGMLLKLGLYPLEDDGTSWDLEWIRRADRWVAAMNERGVYCPITLFEPWSRKRGTSFEFSLDSSEHVLDAWSAMQTEEKENYVRYALARFSGYANVYWELANRARHPGFEDRVFVEQANTRYSAWLERYDPYGVAIAASDIDQARAIDQVDIEVPRFNTHLPSPPDSRKARVVNELVHDCGPVATGARAYLNATIRDPGYRLCYRSASWIAFTSGAYGSAAASWLDLSKPLTAPVEAVLADLGRLRRFIDELPVPAHRMLPDEQHVVLSTGHLGTRSLPGHLYVSYFRGPEPPGEITVEIAAGRYDARWIDPATGEVLAENTHLVRRSLDRTLLTLERPSIGNDAVLVLHNTAALVVR